MKEKIVNWFINTKTWILSFGILGIAVWWIIKILICIFAGICLL